MTIVHGMVSTIIISLCSLLATFITLQFFIISFILLLGRVSVYPQIKYQHSEDKAQAGFVHQPGTLVKWALNFLLAKADLKIAIFLPQFHE